MRLRTFLFITGLMVAAMVLLAFPSTDPVAAQDDPAGDPERGAELFAQNCVACHGESGEGRVGATLNDAFASINVDAFIKQVVRQGVSGSYMPAFSEEYGGPLTDQDITDIAAYIETWDTAQEPVAPAPPRPEQDIPPVPSIDGDPNEGYTIFHQNCAVCHGENAEGRIGATLNEAFAAIDPGAFAISTINRGVEGTLMPPWNQAYGGPLTDQEVNDVAAYVLSIQQEAPPTDEGENVGRGSALPLVIGAGVALVVIVILGVAAQRREQANE